MKRFRVRFINEEAIMQSATVPGNVDTQEETTEDIAQDTDLVANTTPTLQEQDVDGLEDKDVMNYVYFNAPQDIDDGTRQALFNRADQIRQKQMSGSTTPQDQEEFAKGVIAAAAQTKNKATLGESLDEYDFSDKGDFFDFCFSLGSDVADRLRADAKMSFDNTNDAVWGLVTDWIESHKDIVQKLWQKKSSYDTDPSDYDIHVVKRHVLPLFLKKFGK